LLKDSHQQKIIVREEKMKLKAQLNLLGKTWMFLLQTIPIPRERTAGKSSRIPYTHYHILPFDYYEIDERTMVDELMSLIQEYRLGNLHVFKIPDREHAYHVVCLDYFILNEVKRIVMASSCDIGFVIAPRCDRFRNWVLRDFPKGSRCKPKYIYTIASPFDGNRKQSSAHAVFLNANYGSKIELSNPDENTILRIESYLTGKRI